MESIRSSASARLCFSSSLSTRYPSADFFSALLSLLGIGSRIHLILWLLTSHRRTSLVLRHPKHSLFASIGSRTLFLPKKSHPHSLVLSMGFQFISHALNQQALLCPLHSTLWSPFSRSIKKLKNKKI